jgi:hypothetical protein
MLSVIEFAALAAPVVVQEHEVRVSVVGAAKDGTATSPLRRDPSDKWLANAADRTNAPPIPRSSDSGYRGAQEPRQHNPDNPAPPIAKPPLDLNVDPIPSPRVGPLAGPSPGPTTSSTSQEPTQHNPALPIAKPPLDLNVDPIPSPRVGPLAGPGPGLTSPSSMSQAPTDEQELTQHNPALPIAKPPLDLNAAPIPSPRVGPLAGPGPGPTSPSPTNQHNPALPIAKPPLDLNAALIPSPRLPVGPGLTSPSPMSHASTSQEPTDEQEPTRQHNPALPIAKPPLDPNAAPIPSPRLPVGPGPTSTSPTSQVPTDEPDPLNPSSPHGNADLNTSPYQGQRPTYNSDRWLSCLESGVAI